MKIIKLTNKTSELLFSLDELLILKNSLLEVYQQFTVNDFAALIRGISKDEALQFANLLRDIIYHYETGSNLASSDKLILSIQRTEEGVVLLLTYETLLGIRSILNVLYHRVCLKIKDENFQLKIGFEPALVHSLLESIRCDVIEQIEKDHLETIIFNKSHEISNSLNLKHHNLSGDSLSPQIRKECRLQFQSHLILFLLFSQNKIRKVFSGIQILIGKPSHHSVIFAKSNVGLIRHDDLVRLVAYLELALTAEINDSDLEEFVFSLFYANSHLLDIQALSRSIESEGEKNIKIRFRLYSPLKENNRDYEHLDIEDTLSTSNIYSFTSSIREFLFETVKKLEN
jgi:hypothetical protein